ncbi:hypothetical protein EG327_009311 [Venturia inaequalis]|uniref:Uncharacterized protein n=1 Tax=Venturia inaequalis TaxID=5025 RepID=A0A8H3VLB1_VENIN|nr:hypothetical protein EG327_009311 [Venturia inaequalis]
MADSSRPPRQPPITRLNSPALGPSLDILLTPPPNHKEPVRNWSTLPFPYTISFPSPLETGYALQPSTAEHINQIDNRWSSLQHHQFLDTLRERGQETHLDPVAVQTLTHIGDDFRRRREKMDNHNSLPLEQQVPSANMMPNNMAPHHYLAQLQQVQRNARIDEQVYRVREGLPSLPARNNILPQPSEEQQAGLPTEGVQVPSDGLVYQQAHTSSTFMQQGPNQYYAPPSPDHYDSSSHVHAETHGRVFNNADRQFSGSEHPLTMLTTPLQLSPTLAAQPTPTHIQTFNAVGEQSSEFVNQDHFDSHTSIMPQQTMRMGTGQNFQGFESSMGVSHEMAMLSQSTMQPPGQIISGNNLQQYDELRQKQRKEQELKLMSITITSVLKQQPSIDMFRAWLLRSNNILPPLRNMIWNHQALAPWRKQKHMEYMTEVQECGRLVHESNMTYSELFTLAQQRERSLEWAGDVARCANGRGWNAELKRSELTHILQQVAERAVLKNVSWEKIHQFASHSNYPRYQFLELIAEMRRRGWNLHQKQAEYQQQQQMMRDPSAFTTQNQPLLPVQQFQQQPMQNPNHIQGSQTMSPPQQIQPSIWNQAMSPPQQIQQQQRSMTPAMMNNSSPQQQPNSQRQYNQNMLHQQQTQTRDFLPTPSPGASSRRTEAFQAQMQNASNQGQGIPAYPNQMGVSLGDPSETFLNFSSPSMSRAQGQETTASLRDSARADTASPGSAMANFNGNRQGTPAYHNQMGVSLGDPSETFLNFSSPSMSRTQGQETTASPRDSARADTASPGSAMAKFKGNRQAKEPEPWEKQSGVLHLPSPSFEDPTTQQNHMETSMRKQQTGSQAEAAEEAARKQGQGQRHAHSEHQSMQMHNADAAQGTSFEQAHTNNTAPTARMVAKRPIEDEAELESEMPKRNRLGRGVREWKTG